MTMEINSYGERARKHWQQWLPKRYRQIEDPDSYFSMLGEEISQRINEVSQSIAGSDQPGEGFLAKLGRLNMARFDAESQVLREMALLDPEPEVEDQQ
jgi:hypothetical protein